MADVDLSVEVASAGVPDALNKLRELRKEGIASGSALTELGAASERAGRRIATALSDATKSSQNYKKAITDTGKEATSLTRSLSQMEKEYTRLSSLKIGSSPLERLTLAGNGDIGAGRALAEQVRLMREAFSADPVRDLMAVERQELAVLEQRRQKLADIASRQSANQSLSRAREDLTNQRNGITAVEAAQIRLTRATEDLARAEAARRATGISSSNQQRTAAIEQEAAATQRLVAAERELADAQKQTEKSGSAFQSSFSYFIIAGLAQQVTQSILSVGAAAVTASSEIERSFADVERTFDGTDTQLAGLQDRLRSLATEAPVSVVDLAGIATLGNQLGVAANDIEGFTTTIAQYTAVSGQSAEDAATAFGRISNLTGLAADQYSNLASAITYVARTSVATESTIQNTAKEITALASGAGFSADAIVGLAGALSSLAIPPERARGALSLYFGALNGAVAEGGPKLAAFAQLTQMTTDQLRKLVSENRGQEVFTAFISGLSELDTVAKTTALDTLGLSTIRVDQTMRALAQNVPLVTQSLAGAKTAFEENTEIANQYAIIQETLASKLIEFQNAIQLASGAVGDALAPALKELLSLATDIIVNFTTFAKSPVGAFLIGLAGAVTSVVLVLSTLIGALSLVKAGLTVIPWALSGLSASTASKGVLQFLAALLSTNLAVKDGEVQTTRLSGALRATNATSRAAAAGFSIMRGALISTGIGLAVVLVGTLVAALMDAGNAAKLTADQVVGLEDAIRADTKTYSETGKAVATFSAASAGSTTDQEAAAEASRRWARVLGTDLVNGATAAKDAVEQIAAGDTVVEAFKTALSNDTSFTDIISSDAFAVPWQRYGLKITDSIALGLKAGGDEGKLEDALIAQLEKVGIKRVWQEGVGATYTDIAGNDVNDFVMEYLKLVPVLTSTGVLMQDTANKTGVLNSGLAAVDVDPLTDGFRGAKDALTDFQDALQTGISKFVGFDTILETVKGFAEAAAKEADDDSLLSSMVNATAFGQELDAANTRAQTFFDGISKLAAGGSTEFATQLASIGPDAQGILSSALDLGPEAQASLEEAARLAAFYASDQFKSAFAAEMETNNDAYARIFEKTGNISDVKAYIAAQVAGTGEEFERQWAINHPDAPLNVDLINPTDEDLAVWRQQLEGRLTVKAKVTAIGYGGGTGDSVPTNTYTDTVTGASITLPADLDGTALTASLAYWSEHQNATPEQIAAALNTEGFNKNIDDWVVEHGPVTIYANIVPITSNSPGADPFGLGKGIKRAEGGPVQRRAGGGIIRGPGTPTSDTIPLWASRNEYIQNADATKFWGVDFMDSLNRKMLPTAFLNMLGAAATGNSGPSHVTNVNVTQVNPVTRDPLKQLREKSEMVVAGIWE